jgi:proteasome lid subunit RPN8/RPN11
MLELNAKHVDDIKRHGEADYPHECCGLLIGQFSENNSKKIVLETYPISNAREEEAKRNRFLITDKELMRGEKYARERKLDVIGFYHSHPNCPAVPSGYDLDHALPTYSYIIVSVVEGSAVDLKSWEQEPDRSKFNQEEIVIKNQ